MAIIVNPGSEPIRTECIVSSLNKIFNNGLNAMGMAR